MQVIEKLVATFEPLMAGLCRRLPATTACQRAIQINRCEPRALTTASRMASFIVSGRGRANCGRSPVSAIGDDMRTAVGQSPCTQIISNGIMRVGLGQKESFVSRSAQSAKTWGPGGRCRRKFRAAPPRHAFPQANGIADMRKHLSITPRVYGSSFVR